MGGDARDASIDYLKKNVKIFGKFFNYFKYQQPLIIF